jgi:hypothetical protein
MKTSTLARKAVAMHDRLESVTEKMVGDILTEDFQQQFSKSVTPAIEKFQSAHPLIAVSYSFRIQLNDGQLAAKGSLELNQKKQIAALRKYREALALQEARTAAKSAA